MISKIKSLQINYLAKMYNSIAFYPTTVALSLLLLSILLIDIDGNGNIKKIMEEHAPYLVINNADTARIILSTLIGGVISLTVFSFSMVMITLNQASANFSPRLLPGLISEKKNQFVLGFYLGTIIYNLIVLISVLPTTKSFSLNVLSIIVGILLGIICLTLFIYFIHNISSSIQIENILNKVFLATKDEITSQDDYGVKYKNQIDISEEWKSVQSDKEGYYNGFDADALLQMCEKYKMNVVINMNVSDFILPNDSILYIDATLNKSEIEDLLKLFNYSHKNTTSSHYIFGINQITEVGIKSMSPGINDPATAAITLNYLSVLFNERMKIPDHQIYQSEKHSFVIQQNRSSFCKILNDCFSSFRTYAHHDVIIMKKLLSILDALKNNHSTNLDYQNCIDIQLKILLEEAELNLKNKFVLEDFMKDYQSNS